MLFCSGVGYSAIVYNGYCIQSFIGSVYATSFISIAILSLLLIKSISDSNNNNIIVIVTIRLVYTMYFILAARKPVTIWAIS